MLRVILATLGVALIGFGLFGGKSLEHVYAGLNGMVGKKPDVLEESSTVLASSSEQPAPDGAGSDGADSNEVGLTTVSAAAVSVTKESATLPPSDQAGAEAAVVAAALPSTSEQAESVLLASAADDASGTTDQTEERKLNFANAQPGESDPSLQEVKASSRNEELELALATAGGDESSSPKEAVVGEILQTTAGAKDAEALFVLKDLVNMRQGPSIEHPVVLRLSKGQELMEFKRDGKWVHVGAYGTSGKIGWVHERLVGKTPG